MRTYRTLIVLAALALALGACGSAASLPNVPGGADAVGETGGSIETDGSRAGAGTEPGSVGGTDQFGDENAIGARDDAKIIRNGSIELEVSDIAKALRTARDAIVALGGYVGASNTSNGEDRPSAQMTYRIPADRWEDALDVLRSLNGLTTKVVTEQTDAVEVTGQVIDLQARIRNLRASETALQGIAAKATRISDVLEVEARLTDVRGQIEQLAAQLEDLNDRAAYATLTAYFSNPVVAVEEAAKDWEPATVVDEAAASMISVLQALAGAGIWFLIVWLPILLALGLLFAVGAWLARRAGIGRRREGPGLLPPPAGEAGAADGWR